MKIVFTVIVAVCLLSFEGGSVILPVHPPTKSDGAVGGVWVDEQGNLRIEAELFVIEANPKNPGLKKADAARNGAIVAFIDQGDGSVQRSTFGSISNGRLSLSFPKPEDDDLKTASSQFIFFPADWFIQGADVKIGSLFLYTYPDWEMLTLTANPRVSYGNNGAEREYYSIQGRICDYFYSQGDMVISGNSLTPASDLIVKIRFTQGWNVFYSSSSYDEKANKETETLFSKNLPDNAVWVLRTFP